MNDDQLPGWIAAHNPLTIISWPYDHVPEETLHSVSDPYVEHEWLPIIGPTGFVVWRRLVMYLAHNPSGIRIELREFAPIVGLGERTSINSALVRSMARMVRFSWATPIEEAGGALAVRMLLRDVSAKNRRRVARSGG